MQNDQPTPLLETEEPRGLLFILDEKYGDCVEPMEKFTIKMDKARDSGRLWIPPLNANGKVTLH
jgi:hypothetical protein